MVPLVTPMNMHDGEWVGAKLARLVLPYLAPDAKIIYVCALSLCFLSFNALRAHGKSITCNFITEVKYVERQVTDNCRFF